MAAHHGIALRQFLDDTEISVTDFSNKIGLTRATVYSMFGREKFDKELRNRIQKSYPKIDFDIVYTQSGGDDAEILRRLDEIDKWRQQINVDLALIKRLLTKE